MSCGFTCHIISYSHCCESDHNKVDGVQRAPVLNVFKDDSRDGDKDYAASQDEQDGRRHSNLRLADLFVFLLRQYERDPIIMRRHIIPFMSGSVNKEKHENMMLSGEILTHSKSCLTRKQLRVGFGNMAKTGTSTPKLLFG